MHPAVHRRDGQIGAVSAACLVARFDGRPDPDLRADPCRDHGDRRHLHGGAHVADVRTVRYSLSFVMVIGAITALFMGFLGMIQNDIKRVIAYSTLSQLGYMTVALGASAYSVAIFHLMTHAFFKALLFLAAGSVIIAMHHDQDIRNMGGLRKYMPVTWITFLIGSLALIGTPFFSGFYSKDSIIEAVELSHLPGAGFAYFAVVAGVFVTAFYTFRMYFLVFHGEERFGKTADRRQMTDKRDSAAHDEAHGHDEHHHGLAPGQKPHESPWVVTLPLVLLAIPSVVIGYFTIEPILFGNYFKEAIYISAEHPGMAELADEFHGPLEKVLHAVYEYPFWLALSGVVTAWFFYMKRPDIPAALQKRFSLHLHLAGQQILFRPLQRLVLCRRRARCQPLPVEVRRHKADRRSDGERYGETGRPVFRGAEAPPVRLYLSLCVFDDHRRVRAADGAELV